MTLLVARLPERRALLTKPPTNINVPYVQVEDTLDGLWDMARLSRGRYQGQVVAITGSAGKTTAKSWLGAVLEPLCKVHSSIGSLNNHWGVPLSLSRMSANADVGVIEIGTNRRRNRPLERPFRTSRLGLVECLTGTLEFSNPLTLCEQRSCPSLVDCRKGVSLCCIDPLAAAPLHEVTFGLELMQMQRVVMK